MNAATIPTNTDLFDIELADKTVILTPVTDLRDLDYQRIEADTKTVLRLIERDVSLANVIVDSRRADYFGSSAVGLFVRLLKRVKCRDGQMIFCNVSDHEREILEITQLNQLWPILASREEALAAMGA